MRFDKNGRPSLAVLIAMDARVKPGHDAVRVPLAALRGAVFVRGGISRLTLCSCFVLMDRLGGPMLLTSLALSLFFMAAAVRMQQ
jgi:hypothetical protein